MTWALLAGVLVVLAGPSSPAAADGCPESGDFYGVLNESQFYPIPWTFGQRVLPVGSTYYAAGGPYVANLGSTFWFWFGDPSEPPVQIGQSVCTDENGDSFALIAPFSASHTYNTPGLDSYPPLAICRDGEAPYVGADGNWVIPCWVGFGNRFIVVDEPDSDGDGWTDGTDQCPSEAGSGSNNGCPGVGDIDGDGTPDENDDCPSRWGPASNRGCPPIADRDGDGVPDPDDNCPDDANADQADVDDDGVGDACDPPDHYRIKLKAWIPHPRVVDPVWPVELPRQQNSVDSIASPGGQPGCGLIPGPLWQSSTFRGDNHRTFDGGYRVQVVVDFDWDGRLISNFRSNIPNNYGTTHRDWSFLLFNGRTRTCTTQATATTAASARPATALGNVVLSYHSRNPLITPSPPIDGRLKVHMGPTSMSVTVQTDLFPSHGYQIIRNGELLRTHVVNNAACVNALGPVGAANLLHRLNTPGPERTKVIDLRSTTATDLVATCS